MDAVRTTWLAREATCPVRRDPRHARPRVLALSWQRVVGMGADLSTPAPTRGDSLADGATRRPTTWSPWAREYARTDRYVFGTDPSPFATRLLRLLPARARVLELGAGEGRDCVFFARHGLDVTGVEMAPEGLVKARRLAESSGVWVRWVEATLPDVPVSGQFDLVYSCGSIHYVARRDRPALFRRLREVTRPGGYHSHVVFTTRLMYREKGEAMDAFEPGELAREYGGWQVRERREGLIACAQDGTRHAHSVEELVARRPIGPRARR